MSREIPPTGKYSAPSSSPEQRASHADRDRVVDMLRTAAGDGLLTTAELDERVEVALSARTHSELAPLTADLPPASTSSTSAAPGEVKDVLRIDRKYSTVERVGHWVVPRRLEVAAEWCTVTLDFTQAVITQDTLQIDVDMEGKTLTLVTRPGVLVDVDAMSLEYCKVKARQVPALGVPIALRVELVGRKRYGHIVVRPPRRTFGQWLLRKPPS